MADKIPENATAKIETKGIAQTVEELRTLAGNQRKTFARHWYDNNFFDDGHHYRFISRTTGRIVDMTDRSSLYSPRRAIPKASRQIRGMANLLLSNDYIPVIKPEKVNMYQEGAQDDVQQAKLIAKRVGHWITEEWKNQDFDIKLAQMVLLTLKNSVSYMQVFPDPVEEAIKTMIYDAFDIYLINDYTSIYDSPFIGKEIPKTVPELKANEWFDKTQLGRITPDNRYASDEIKEAYLASKFGKAGRASDVNATLILKEYFIKEYMNKDNRERIRKQKNGGEILKDKKEGDPVIRQVFCSGKVWLRDEYVNLTEYPFVDLRWEPGRIYQVAPIERFIHANKSLDSVMSRLERFIHTMNVGVWLKRKGENFKIANVAGGLVGEYENVPPQQMNLANFPASTFNFIDLLNTFIEEQGVSTSALAKVPKGVKAWGAIESLKASEFANLYIPIKQLKDTIKRITEKMLDIADRNFLSQQTVMRLEKGEPDYFDVIGNYGYELRNDKLEGAGLTDGVIPLKKDYGVDIQIESGLGYTEEGKKGRMMEIANFMLGLGEAGLVPPAALKAVVQKLMEIFKFGPAADMMEALDGMENMGQMSPDQLDEMKVALLETLRDAQGAGLFKQDPQEQVDLTKVGVAEVIKDTGLADRPEEQQGEREVTKSETIETGKDGRKTKKEYKVVQKT